MSNPNTQQPDPLDRTFLTVVSVATTRKGETAEHVRSRFNDSPDTVVGQMLRELAGDDKAPLEISGRLVVWTTPLSQLADAIASSLPKEVLAGFIGRLKNTNADSGL